MSNVYPFAPRRPAAAPVALPAPSSAEIRHQIEEAVQAALDTADRLIARLDGDADREDGGDAETSLGAPEGHASQVVWLHGTASDTEQDAAQ
jgi:hypothetical protein